MLFLLAIPLVFLIGLVAFVAAMSAARRLRKQVERLAANSQSCLCGYDLSGVPGMGVCPECGREPGERVCSLDFSSALSAIARFWALQLLAALFVSADGLSVGLMAVVLTILSGLLVFPLLMEVREAIPTGRFRIVLALLVAPPCIGVGVSVTARLTGLEAEWVEGLSILVLALFLPIVPLSAFTCVCAYYLLRPPMPRSRHRP